MHDTNDRGEHEQDDAVERGGAEVTLVEAGLVDEEFHGRRGVTRTAPGHDENETEQRGEQCDHGDHEGELDEAAEVGQRDATKDAPASRAVDACRLLEAGIERGESGEEQDRVGADHGEDEGDPERAECGGLVTQHVGVGVREAEEVDDGVERALVREEAFGNEAQHDPGDRGGHEVDGAKDSPTRHTLVQQDRDEERYAQREGHREEQQRVVLQRGPEIGVVKRLGPGGRADPRRRETVPGGEGVVDGLANGYPDETNDQRERGEREDEAGQLASTTKRQA